MKGECFSVRPKLAVASTYAPMLKTDSGITNNGIDIPSRDVLQS